MIILSFLGNFAMFLVPVAPPAFLAYALSKKSREEWRLLAYVPVAPLALWAPWIAWDVTRDPTSHNLWPFEAVMWGLLSLVMFGLFLVGRAVFGRERKDLASRVRARRTPP